MAFQSFRNKKKIKLFCSHIKDCWEKGWYHIKEKEYYIFNDDKYHLAWIKVIEIYKVWFMIIASNIGGEKNLNSSYEQRKPKWTLNNMHVSWSSYNLIIATIENN